jgi:hypothetical protein
MIFTIVFWAVMLVAGFTISWLMARAGRGRGRTYNALRYPSPVAIVLGILCAWYAARFVERAVSAGFGFQTLIGAISDSRPLIMLPVVAIGMWMRKVLRQNASGRKMPSGEHQGRR